MLVSPQRPNGSAGAVQGRPRVSSGETIRVVPTWIGSRSTTATAACHSPTGPNSGPGRSIRGGSWYHEAPDCRSAYRAIVPQDYRDNDLGFRVAFSGI